MLRSILEHLFLFMYALALMASLYRYPKYYDTRLKYLPIVFCYTLLNEVLGYMTAYMPQFGFFDRESIANRNMVIYNIYNVIFYLYFFFIYKHHIRQKANQRAVDYGTMIFIAVALSNPFFQNFLLSAQTATYVVGGIFLLAYICLYLNEQAKHGNTIRLKNHLLVWISLGLFIFYTGYLPIKVSRFINAIDGTTEAPYVRLVHYGLIIAMYAVITVGFVKLKKRLPR
ncbi:hypothetical protein [Pseudozobellia thermophila]|uniref:Uncharacterized protein n=1 Tax=Pseudozobellia thermophila TaxID=192903 RepID=A0A1M6HIJ9_9FLAO|nr:hypothetical protein [Pseudozobellia thermophila]SHJ21974.1 hypothetical protein SAMN04488513_10363 [Pseudozobellia thermophila]